MAARRYTDADSENDYFPLDDHHDVMIPPSSKASASSILQRIKWKKVSRYRVISITVVSYYNLR